MGRIAADTSAFYAIADPTRRAILDLLREEAGADDARRTVLVILERLAASIVGLSQSSLSQHLAVLLRAGLVTARKEGRTRVYSLRANPLSEVADWIGPYDRFWGAKLDNLHKFLESHGRSGRS
ncbi:MAG: winged helix-turn-helix transcriptional regulator [Phycisphaeraceae bacterium]|nr:winged helix-turn-helix transcriptional regulator [Phycisphaeraceae bacterium]